MGHRLLTLLMGVPLLGGGLAHGQVPDEYKAAVFLQNWDKATDAERVRLRALVDGIVLGVTHTEATYQVDWQTPPLFCFPTQVDAATVVDIVRTQLFLNPKKQTADLAQAVIWGLETTFPCSKPESANQK